MNWTDCDCVPGHRCDCHEVRTERDELRALFDLQQTRMEKATALWRKGNPGNDHVLPDLGRLLDYLMSVWPLIDTNDRPLGEVRLMEVSVVKDPPHPDWVIRKVDLGDWDDEA